jgi:hypothetical protein
MSNVKLVLQTSFAGCPYDGAPAPRQPGDLRTYLLRWKHILAIVSDGRILRAMWGSPTERKRRDQLEWPAGIREGLTGCVEARGRQLDPTELSSGGEADVISAGFPCQDISLPATAPALPEPVQDSTGKSFEPFAWFDRSRDLENVAALLGRGLERCSRGLGRGRV